MKHLTLNGDIVVTQLLERDGSRSIVHFDKSEAVLGRSGLSKRSSEGAKLIMSDIPAEDIFIAFLSYYGRYKAYECLKAINFKFE